jgi:hypothetical protein
MLVSSITVSGVDPEWIVSPRLLVIVKFWPAGLDIMITDCSDELNPVAHEFIIANVSAQMSNILIFFILFPFYFF